MRGEEQPCLLGVVEDPRAKPHGFVRSHLSLWTSRHLSFVGCWMLMQTVNVNTYGPGSTFSALGVLINWPISLFSTCGRYFVQEEVEMASPSNNRILKRSQQYS